MNDKKLEELYDAVEAELEALDTNNKSEQQTATTSRLAEASLQALNIDTDRHKSFDKSTTGHGGQSGVNNRTNRTKEHLSNIS